MTGFRLPSRHGEVIDRAQPLDFQFNGKTLQGFAGDTLASALLASGVRLVGRSFKLHRPRGILSCGVEEPTVVDLGGGATRVANSRPTDVLLRAGLHAHSSNCWPSVGLDAGAITALFARFLPAGFYYKTFMWPNWHWFEPTIRAMAGLGRAADGPDPDRYEEVSLEVDVLVVGAGAAGLQAALSAARAGRDVLVLEDTHIVGGWAAGQATYRTRIDSLLEQLAAAGARVMTRTTVLGMYDHQFTAALQSEEGTVRERLLKIRSRRVVLATGSFERPMLFPDNDRPGVMLAGAVERYASHYGAACGKRIAIATACDDGYEVAGRMRRLGLDVRAVIDLRSSAGVVPPEGVAHFPASAIVQVQGRGSVTGARVAPLAGGKVKSLDVDTIAMHGGFTPNVSLYSQAGGVLQWHPETSMFVPQSRLRDIDIVGAAAGIFDFDAAREHAEAIGAGREGRAVAGGGVGRVASDTSSPRELCDRFGGRGAKIFIDLQNDVALTDVQLAARENYRSVEHLKRYTTTGMATDQGKTSNVNALVQLGIGTRRSPDQVGTTRFRPPFKPVTLNAIAAGRSGSRYKPLKHLPAHRFHVSRGALSEEFAGWLRPAAYPRTGESIDQAAQREAAATRSGVGLFEGSPLGKIEVFGPDAAAFLDLMYVGTMSTLAVGQARYGALLNENGIVFDDGIAARLGPDRFWINTTSGGVERVAHAFEEWLQCEFVDLRVHVMPVTSQWGNVTVAGPNAWKLLEAAGFDASLSPATMKHMTMREVSYAGVNVRVLRASFSGELGYEINLPAAYTLRLIERLWSLGRNFGATMYGVEALMLMRLEKGFLHIGADTDGTTFPGDVGLDRAVAKKLVNFVGRRSLSRPSATDANRLQLVGLKPMDGKTLLAVGAHIASSAPPAQAEGHVTSSGFSPALREPIALAMLSRGRQRTGERVRVHHMGRVTEAVVVTTPFFDPAGERLHG